MYRATAAEHVKFLIHNVTMGTIATTFPETSKFAGKQIGMST